MGLSQMFFASFPVLSFDVIVTLISWRIRICPGKSLLKDISSLILICSAHHAWMTDSDGRERVSVCVSVCLCVYEREIMFLCKYISVYERETHYVRPCEAISAQRDNNYYRVSRGFRRFRIMIWKARSFDHSWLLLTMFEVSSILRHDFSFTKSD